MAGASLEYSLAPLEGLVERLRAGLNDLGPLMEDIGAELSASAQRRFETKQAPDGAAWEALAAATIARRLKAKGGEGAGDILVFSGALSQSVSYEAESDQVTITMGGSGNSTAYAAIHQFGGRAGRGRKVNIPARPVLGLSSEDEAAVGRIIEEYFWELMYP